MCIKIYFLKMYFKFVSSGDQFFLAKNPHQNHRVLASNYLCMIKRVLVYREVKMVVIIFNGVWAATEGSSYQSRINFEKYQYFLKKLRRSDKGDYSSYVW